MDNFLEHLSTLEQRMTRLYHGDETGYRMPSVYVYRKATNVETCKIIWSFHKQLCIYLFTQYDHKFAKIFNMVKMYKN